MCGAAGASLVLANTERVASRWRWRSLWVGLACFALGLVCVSIQFSVVTDGAEANLTPYLEGVLGWDILVGVVSACAVGPMHRGGRWNLVLIAAAGVSSMATPAAAVAMIRLGGRRRRRDDILLVVTSLLFLVGVNTALLAPSLGYSWGDLSGVPLIAAITWGFIMWGRSRADREALIVSLQDKAASAHREREALDRERRALVTQRDAELARTRSDERTAIARDMHDSLSHHLALIAMHAGALAYREDLAPAQMRATARTLRDAAEAANVELRDVLTALRAQDGGHVAPRALGSTTPLPTSRTMTDAIAAARARGQRITVRYEGTSEEELTTLPATTAAALHRIVGELVVNAGKHAPGAPLTLELSRTADALIVRAHNPLAPTDGPDAGPSEPPALGTGLGLAGVAERARLLGGSARQVDGGAQRVFVVEVHVPWRR